MVYFVVILYCILYQKKTLFLPMNIGKHIFVSRQNDANVHSLVPKRLQHLDLYMSVVDVIYIRRLLEPALKADLSLYSTGQLRIDTGGWSVICCALFNEVPTKGTLANYHTLYVIK